MRVTIKPWNVRKRVADPSGGRDRLVIVGTEGFEVNIRLLLPDGTRIRERTKCDVPARSAAERWAELRVQELMRDAYVPKPPQAASTVAAVAKTATTEQATKKKATPTLAEFAERFLTGYAKVNNKASEEAAKRSIINTHLKPRFGSTRLDEITTEDVERMKADLLGKKRSKKTVNNVLAVLRRMLAVAVDWDVLPNVRAKIHQFKVPRPLPKFYEAEDLKRLLEVAPQVDYRLPIIILLGADAGLRLGEMLALEQAAIDFRRNKINVDKSDWHGTVDTPKGAEPRLVPMTDRLEAALKKHRHLRGKLVLCHDDGTPLDRNSVKRMMVAGQRAAKVKATGGIHILRHTFCSRLGAQPDVAPRAIMAVAGHKDIETSMRYIHLFRGATESAIATLNRPEPPQVVGERRENKTDGHTSS
jgi:integrase